MQKSIDKKGHGRRKTTLQKFNSREQKDGKLWTREGLQLAFHVPLVVT
jgi:hypothetical protein